MQGLKKRHYKNQLSTLTDQRENIVATDAAKRFGRNNSQHTINKSKFVNLIMSNYKKPLEDIKLNGEILKASILGIR